MELTREEAIRNFREHWASLAISGSQDKEEYLKRHGYEGIFNKCFLCEYTKYKCSKCPIEWVKNQSGDNNHCVLSWYSEWREATTPEERSRLAALIRDLPEKGEKKETPAPRFAVGQKVVPVSKSIGEFAGDLDSEPNWIDSKKRGYFYVTQSFQHCGKQAYGCHSEDIRTGGNHFLESDLRPYVEPKPAAFKVGDRVRIRKDMEIGERHGYLRVCEGEMEKCRGQETVITSVNPSSCCVKDNSFFWYPTMLELLPPINHCPENKTVTLETVTVTFNGAKTTCIIENELGRFKGCAKCSPDDVWDEQTGAELAKVRAYRKMLEAEERNIRMI